jgi:RNA polymerase sigma-70 factor (sigma-E family)
MGNGAASTIEPEPAATTASFDSFYEAQWQTALRLATLLTQQRAVAEDLAQEAFANVYRAWSRIDRPAAYLNTAIVNACRRWHKREARARERLPLLVAEPTEHPMLGELSDAVAALPYRQRAALVLRYYADLSEAEIADALGCRPGTVKSLVSRGLAELKKVIDQ